MTLSRPFSRVALATVMLAGAARPASAEVVLLTTGRTLSVKSHRAEDDKVTLVLRKGGELTCPASLIVRIDPDEVPYVEEAPSGARSITGLSTVVAFLGGRGASTSDRAVRVSGVSEFEGAFGPCPAGGELASGVSLFFQNGGVEAWVARHASPVPFDRPDDAAAFANINTPDELAS